MPTTLFETMTTKKPMTTPQPEPRDIGGDPQVMERTQRVRDRDERRPAAQPRKRRCNARLLVPGRTPDEGDVLFTCNRDAHVGSQHSEEGRMRTKDDKVQSYVFSWQDVATIREIWRTPRAN